jgi:O-antigen/teichoic acid export membrane protein
VTDLFADLLAWFLAWRELKRRRLLKGIRPTLKPSTLPGAWRFAIHVNLTASVVAAWGPIARVVVGGLLGPAGAALFRVASSIADSAQKPADLLARAFYPEVVRMDLTTKQPWKLLVRTTAFASAIAVAAVILLLIGGKPLVTALFGEQFLGAYPALLILMFVPLIGVFSFPMPPMLYALDRPDAPLKARLAGTITYFIIVAPLSWRFGLIGAALALVAGNAVMVVTMLFQLRSEHRRVRRRGR